MPAATPDREAAEDREVEWRRASAEPGARGAGGRSHVGVGILSELVEPGDEVGMTGHRGGRDGGAADAGIRMRGERKQRGTARPCAFDGGDDRLRVQGAVGERPPEWPLEQTPLAPHDVRRVPSAAAHISSSPARAPASSPSTS